VKHKSPPLRGQAITQQACEVLALYRIWLHRETGVLRPLYELASDAVIKQYSGVTAREKV